MNSFKGIGALAALVAATMACGGGGGTTGPTGLTAPCTKAPFKVGLVTDVGKLSDKSFNYDSYNGVIDAQNDSSLGVQGKAIESSVESDYAKNIQTFLDQKYCMVVTVGFKLGDATIKAASLASWPARWRVCSRKRM
jgi:basic membrane protein A